MRSPARTILLIIACNAVACGEHVAAPDQGDAADGGLCSAVGDALPLAKSPDCNPLAWDRHCLSGLPTAFYQQASASKTGQRVDLPAALMPKTAAGIQVSPAEWNRRDGWSPSAPIVMLPPKPIDAASLHDETTPILGITGGKLAGAVVILDAKTGQALRHFEELDQNGKDPAQQALIVRLWTPAATGKRLIVVVTDQLLGTDGKSMPRPAVFSQLLACQPTGYPRIDAHLQEWRADIETIRAAGIELDHVVTAWHYDTASDDWTTAPALQLREKMLQAVGAGGMGVKIAQVEVDPKFVKRFPNLPVADAKVQVAAMNGDVALRVRGQFEAPLFLTGTGTEATLNWTGTGTGIAQNGTVWRDFVMLVPPRVADGGGKARLLLYGHGLLRGGCIEGCVKPGDAEFFPHFVANAGVVAVATDWWGLSQGDLATAASLTGDLAWTPRVTDKLVQGALQPIALTRAVRGKLLADPWLQVGDDAKSAQPLVDPASDLAYYGNSLGGIMGTTAVALHPDVHRAVMNVAGGVWSLLLNRSSDFMIFLDLLDAAYADAFEKQVLFGLMQSLWDLSDPANFAAHVVAEPLVGTPADRLALWPVSWGDSQVANLASGMLQRQARVPLQVPAVENWPDSLTEAFAQAAKPVSRWVQWDSKRGNYPPGNGRRPIDNGAHIATRWMPEYQQMVVRFLFQDGVVEPRYCLAGGRDGNAALPCDLPELIPEKEAAMKPLIALPVPNIP